MNQDTHCNVIITLNFNPTVSEISRNEYTINMIEIFIDNSNLMYIHILYKFQI